MKRSEMPAALVREIRTYCQAHADAKKAQKWARYFKEGYDAWGMLEKDDPLWNAKQAEWLERYDALGLAGFLKAGEALFESGKYEEGALAIRFLKTRAAGLNAKFLKDLARWFDGGIRNWAHTDVLCGEVIGPALADGRIGVKDLHVWRGAKAKFQRRAAAVALLSLVKAGTAAGPLLRFIEPMMEDQERVVHQGLGWLLRELWKKEPKPVEAFLMDWRETGPRLIFQYATEKMTAEGKARFRRTPRQ
jgi:3-methyladenine DNA glycosylase AlkD